MMFGFMALWDGPDCKPDRDFQAFDPRYQKARPEDSGYLDEYTITSLDQLGYQILLKVCPIYEALTQEFI
jgi:hypothetical protein